MSPIPKTKLCWQCEGNVTFEEDNCPYCGVYLQVKEAEDSVITQLPSRHAEVAFEEMSEEEIWLSPASLYLFKALSLLLLGSTLAFLALILFLFGHEGLFTLQWDATLWHFYLLASLPLLYFGWSALRSLEEQPEE